MATITHQSNDLPKVWQSLKTCLAPRDHDIRFWWQLTGYQLAHMDDAAGMLTYDCSPLEFSWKWNTESESDIRCSWEPFNPGCGTSDPSNHALSIDYMQHHAAEFYRYKNWGLKSYFFLYNCKSLQVGDSTILEECVVAVDDVLPSQSRLKLYFMTPHASFLSLREAMTIGDSNMPYADLVGNTWVDTKDLVDYFVCYFNIVSGRDKPEVKLYFPTRRFGPDDLTLCYQLMQWMTARGRGTYCDRYLAMTKAMGEHRGLENGQDIHSFISYQVIFHP
ncbi:aromatic prenyltransferase [Xylaria longipes]|nr:aromatic prenyltransferase [Xylaria longipes]